MSTLAEVFPPGEFIKEELEERGWTQVDFAAVLGRPLQAVNEILNGKRAITPETARAIGDALGTGPELWLNLESAYQLSQSKPADNLVTRRASLYAHAPVTDIVKRGWTAAEKDDYESLERSILKFMGTKSTSETPRFVAAARKSTSYASHTPAEVAWLQRARLLATCVDAKRFVKSGIEERASDIRDLAVSDADVRRVPHFLSEIGIRLVVVEPLPKMRMDGAVFWLNKQSPVIALSMRFDRIDSFWYTITHELAHVIHGDGQMFCDSNLVGEHAQKYSDKDEEEQRADDFAANLLVPKEQLSNFIARISPLYARKRIVGFANRIGVHPGIVVGQLQFRGEIGYWHSRPLLVKVRSQLTDNAMTDGWGHNPGVIEAI